MNNRHMLNSYSPSLAYALVPVLVALSGCTADVELDDTHDGLVAAAIGNGMLAGSVMEEQYGLVFMPGCSGAAVSDRWIVSAAHCPAAVGNQVTFLGTAYTLDMVVPHPDFNRNDGWDHDIMLAHVSTGLLRPSGTPWAPQDGIIYESYPDEARVLSDNFESMLCFGQSTGVYNFESFRAMRATSRHLVEVSAGTSTGVDFRPGDSGGPCFRFQGSGNPIFAATISQTDGVDADGSTSDGQAMTVTEDIATWIRMTI